MNIHVQKNLIIDQLKQINDINLINAIKSILDYAIKKEKDIYEIPEAHRDLVMERFDKTKKNPGRLLDWDKEKKKL